MKLLSSNWKFLDELLAVNQQHSSIQLQAGLPYFALRLSLQGKRSVVIVTEEEKAEMFAEDARALAEFFPELKNFSIAFMPEQDPQQTAALLDEILEKDGIVWFVTPQALAQKIFAPEEFKTARLYLKSGRDLQHAQLLDHLAHHGYKRADLVEEVGQFALRGEVVDFWSPNTAQPTRLVYNYNTIESMHSFDIATQITNAFIAQTFVIPIFNPQLQSTDATGAVSHYLPTDALWLLDLPEAEFSAPENAQTIRIGFDGANAQALRPNEFHLNWKLFEQTLRRNHDTGWKSFVMCRTMGEAQRLEDVLDQMHCAETIRPQIMPLALNHGFALADLKLCVWSFNELIGSRPVVRRLPKFKMGRALDAISEIHPGDYAVHEKFGIGRYRGLERMKVNIRKKWTHTISKEKVSEFLVLEYKDGDKLYVPVQDFRLVQRYVGQDGKKPQLYSLDGAAWERVKQKVQEDVAQLAEDILQTAAARGAIVRSGNIREFESATGRNMFEEFIAAFPYEETPDQQAASQDVVQDMESGKLMDRLICGDVGYGKTEIAMRAAFKAVCDDRQVAVLVPTTILAEQHYKNFCDRFAAFPVRIGMLSRFQTASEQKQILDDLKIGNVDIVIGTHRLLQKDIEIKNLGLIIIDEEHRFGVMQKERIKKMKLNLDVLALSATPIPRTLSFALGGVRDISIIETAPQGRLPIETVIGVYKEEVVAQAITRELDRGGQVFYVHNRVASIYKRKEMLEKLMPKIRVGVAHGQMSADELESAMWNFLHGKWDVLLATTIIESGLDIPGVNTLIVEDSEEFGLAQLYQLRGRVGRQRQKAYCYLFFSGWVNLTQDARKRLEAIQEFSALGSGIQLAVRDLEIRGMGNFLGAAQHGWVAAVGLEMYCQMLSDAIQTARQKAQAAPGRAPIPIPKEIYTEVELTVSAYIPEDYIPSGSERVVLYKKMISCKTQDQLTQLQSEFADRFGHLPEPVLNLLNLVSIKLEAAALGIAAITETETGFLLSWPIEHNLIPVRFAELAQAYAATVQIMPPAKTAAQSLDILFKEKSEENPFEPLRKILKIISPYVILRKH